MISPPTLVYPGTDLPGTIKFMNSSGEVVETAKFYPGQEYRAQGERQGLELGGERSTSLGQNIYLGKPSGELSLTVRLVIIISNITQSPLPTQSLQRAPGPLPCLSPAHSDSSLAERRMTPEGSSLRWAEVSLTFLENL